MRTYKRSNGQVVPIEQMNDHHILATIKLIRMSGYRTIPEALVILNGAEPENLDQYARDIAYLKISAELGWLIEEARTRGLPT